MLGVIHVEHGVRQELAAALEARADAPLHRVGVGQPICGDAGLATGHRGQHAEQVVQMR